ncbi:MAG: AAA family ATPase [Aeromicrobium sp.]
MSQTRTAVPASHPSVIERDALLSSLSRIADDVGRGRGRLVLLSGEAGVGKTTLLEAFLSEVPHALALRRGGCDNVTTPAPLGPFLEAVPQLGDVPRQANGEDGAAVFRAAGDVLTAIPSLVVLEDVHWADGASLDLIRYLGRRIDRMGLALVVSFRTDELDVSHPLRILLGDLATTPGVARLDVPPLTPAGVQQLARAAGSSIDADGLHRRTGGNAFYVSEVLATSGHDVPATVRDAVLARASRLSDGARQALGAAAVLGAGADVALIAAVAGQDRADVDECVARGVMRADGPRLAFRHEIARRAIEESLSPATRVDLHARALAELLRRGSTDDRRLAHHAEACSDRDAVLAHGLRAAELARLHGAHREAAEHYRTVLAVLPEDSSERADVLDRLANALCLTGHAQEALDVEHQALRLHRAADDAMGSGRAMRWISRLSWMLGRGASSAQYAHRAIETLEPEGPCHELAMAYSNLGQIHMLGDDLEGARVWGDRALDIATDLDDMFVRAHALINIGTAIATATGEDQGFAMLRESIDLSLAHGFVDHAARAYCNLSVSFAAHGRYAEEERVIAEGVAYSAERDLDYYAHYMSAMQAKSAAERGRLDDAEKIVDSLMTVPDLAMVSRIPALTTKGTIALLRGADATALLAEAHRLAVETGEPQRLVPVSLARAEAAWIRGRPDEVSAELDELWDRNARRPHRWRTGELAWWLHVAGVRRELPGPVAEPFALVLAGRSAEAAAAWRELGSPLWAARALATSDDVDDVRRGLRELDAVGAVGARDAVLRDRQRRGLPAIRGPRASSVAHPAGLTARESEVLQLMGRGLTNAEIATELFLSVKTAGHHVSAVLRKLDVSNRARAIAAARERGFLDPT